MWLLKIQVSLLYNKSWKSLMWHRICVLLRMAFEVFKAHTRPNAASLSACGSRCSSQLLFQHYSCHACCHVPHHDENGCKSPVKCFLLSELSWLWCRLIGRQWWLRLWRCYVNHHLIIKFLHTCLKYAVLSYSIVFLHGSWGGYKQPTVAM